VKTPTGRLGMLPSSLQERAAAILQIPQPGGWGSFTVNLQTSRNATTLKHPNPVGGLQGGAAAVPVGQSERTPTFRLGDFARLLTQPLR
jgi:hypothetical protein